MTTRSEAIDPEVAPSGPGCVECEASGGWWVHLRRCATCGHIGCCDTSPSQHATAHWHGTGHRVITSPLARRGLVLGLCGGQGLPRAGARATPRSPRRPARPWPGRARARGGARPYPL